MDQFSLKTKIVMGDALADLAAGYHKVFIVTDHFMAESGMVKYVTERLDKGGTEYQIFSDVHPDPDIGTIAKGVGSIQDFQPEAVVAFGGGAALDAAKATVYFARRQAGLSEVVFIAIPTTSGTGSEVTSFSVITDPEKEIKYPLIDDSLLPDVAVLDPQLTASIPPKISADTGMDVLTHAVEAYVSTGHNDFTDALAEKSIRLVNSHLLSVFLHPEDMRAHQGMHNASCLAGLAFNAAGLGLNHGMAHALGAMFHIPHGRANAILLPYVMSFNASVDGSPTETTARYAQIAGLVGMETINDRQAAVSLIRWTRRLADKLKMPATLRDAGVDEKAFEEALPKIAAAAIADRCNGTNPRPCTEEQAAELFRRAYNGKL